MQWVQRVVGGDAGGTERIRQLGRILLNPNLVGREPFRAVYLEEFFDRIDSTRRIGFIESRSGFCVQHLFDDLAYSVEKCVQLRGFWMYRMPSRAARRLSLVGAEEGRMASGKRTRLGECFSAGQPWGLTPGVRPMTSVGC